MAEATLPEVKLVGMSKTVRRAAHIISYPREGIFLTVAPGQEVPMPPVIVKRLLAEPKLRRGLEAGATAELYQIHGLPAAA